MLRGSKELLQIRGMSGSYQSRFQNRYLPVQTDIAKNLQDQTYAVIFLTLCPLGQSHSFSWLSHFLFQSQAYQGCWAEL